MFENNYVHLLLILPYGTKILHGIMVLQLVADHKIKIYKLFGHENLLHNYRHDIKHDTELP